MHLWATLLQGNTALKEFSMNEKKFRVACSLSNLPGLEIAATDLTIVGVLVEIEMCIRI